jgi:hypothetical protein
VNENTTNGARRAEDILPGGFVPSHLAKPMLRAASTTQLEYVAEGLLDISVASALLSGPIEDAANRHKLADDIHSESRRLYRLVKAIAAGALGLAVLAGVVLSPAGGSTAQAAEGPESDPVAAVSAPTTYGVTLGAAGATARIRVTTPHMTPRGLRCASVWSPVSFLGRACSYRTSFTVPVVLGRYTPLGRSILAVTDDVAPMNTTPARVALEVRRPSRFGAGTWTPTYWGDGLTVSAALYAYTPALGAWTPQKSSPVQVQELRASRWVTVATLTTNSRGVFTGSVTLGGGPHAVRVHRDAGATVTATNGTARDFYLYPTDVPDGTN